MSENRALKVLMGEIEKSVSVLERLTTFLARYIEHDLDVDQKKTEQAMVLVQSVTSYYTCLETIFLRISQFFENSLSSDKWHQDLLQKMTLRIDGVRESVISDETHSALLEILKFRHFTRYYFEFDYDWDKLLYIKDRYLHAVPGVRRDLANFLHFLVQLSRDPDDRVTK